MCGVSCCYPPTATVTPDRMGRPSEVQKMGHDERPVLFSQQKGTRGAPHEGARDEVGGGVTINEMGGGLVGRGTQARACLQASAAPNLLLLIQCLMYY